MSFTRWLYMNNKEKMKILLYILPAIIGSYLIDMVISDKLITSLTIGFIISIFITTYKNKCYVNIIAQKYNKKFHVSLKQAFSQTVGATIVNSLFAILLIVICSALWLLSLAFMFVPLFIVAIVVTIASLISYVTLSKLSYYVILENAEYEELALIDYLKNFGDVYIENFKLVILTMIKVLVYSFICVLLLSFIAIFGYNIQSTIITVSTSLLISFVVYWVDITAIQYLTREYTKKRD